MIRIISKRTHKPFSILDGVSYVLLFAACAVLIIRYDPEEKTVPALPAPARTNLALSTPTCDYVVKIAPKNYAVSSESADSLEAQNYTKCKKCFK